MGQLDIGIKEMAKYNLVELLRWLLPQESFAEIVEMPQELPASLRRVDVLAKMIRQPAEPRLVIVESQAQKDLLLRRCMLLRAGLVHMHYDLPVSSILLALKAEAVVEERYVFGTSSQDESVHAIDVRRVYQESADRLFRTGPEALWPLAPVMQPEDGNRVKLLEQTLLRLAELPVSKERKDLLINWATTFASLHLSETQVKLILAEVARRRHSMLTAIYDTPLMRNHFEHGKEKGREEGLEKGLRQSIVAVLQARRVKMDAEDLLRINGCTDVAALNRWLSRAAVASSITEVLEP